MSGFRFRRSIRLGKGLRINMSKSGASLSVGRRGATMNFGPKGNKVTLGVPGTGISYSTKLKSHPDRQSPASQPGRTSGALVWLLAIAIAAAIIIDLVA